MRGIGWKMCLAVSLLVYPGVLMATLYDRGNNLIYDDVQNITWLDFAYDPGLDDWDATEAWVQDLEYMGVESWRAPSLEELLYLGRNEFRQSGQYDATPFTNVSAGRGEFYLTSSLAGVNQRWAYSLEQDRIFQTWPVASIYGVAVMDGDIVPVPEPGTFFLLGIGCSCLVLRTYRHRQMID